MLDPKIVAALQEHANIEAGNSAAYLTLASLCKANGLPGFGKKWCRESADELGHAAKFMNYLARFDIFINVTPDVGATPVLTEESSNCPVLCAQAASQLEADTEQSMRDLVINSAADPDVVQFVSEQLAGQSLMSKEARDFAKKCMAMTPGELQMLDAALNELE